MTTHEKTYEFRECLGCFSLRKVRTDSKSLYCGSCAKRNTNNPMYKGESKLFKGTTQEYKKYHMRVYRKRGKATYCINGCIANRYEWSNRTGQYDNIDDYDSMCKPCHVKRDRGLAA